MGFISAVKKVAGFVTGGVPGVSGGEALDIVSKGTDGLINGIDKLVFTAEEKADFVQKRSETALKMSEMHIKLMETIGSENTARSITRRKLAVMTIETFLFLLILSAGLWKVDAGWSEAIFNRVEAMDGLVTGIGIFYFGYYGAKEIIKVVKGNE